MNSGSLIASMIVSTIGFSFFLYGKKQQRAPQLLAGVLMMVFPYFVANAAAVLGIGALLTAAVVVAGRQGF